MKKLALIVLGVLLMQGVNAQKFVIPTIPGNIEKSEYAKYTQDAMSCVDWLKSHGPKAARRDDVATFAFWWITGTPDVHMTLTEDMMKFKDSDLLMLMLGGWAQYAVQNNSDDQLEGCLAGVNTALEYYEKYRKELPRDKGAEQFIKMRDKGTLKSYLEKAMVP